MLAHYIYVVRKESPTQPSKTRWLRDEWVLFGLLKIYVRMQELP